MMQTWLTTPILEAVQKLKPIAAEAGCSLAAVRPGLGAARAQRRLGHRRGQPARAAGGERRRLRPRHRPGLFARAEALVAGVERGA